MKGLPIDFVWMQQELRRLHKDAWTRHSKHKHATEETSSEWVGEARAYRLAQELLVKAHNRADNRIQRPTDVQLGDPTDGSHD